MSVKSELTFLALWMNGSWVPWSRQSLIISLRERERKKGGGREGEVC